MTKLGPMTTKTFVRRLRDEAGAAAVEFALVLPVLVLILGGIVEFGRAWNVRQVLTDAAREGARVAVVNNTMPAAQLQALVKSTILDAGTRAGLNTDPAVLKIALTGIPNAANTPATVALDYEYDPLFGKWVMKSGIPLKSSFVMRNE